MLAQYLNGTLRDDDDDDDFSDDSGSDDLDSMEAQEDEENEEDEEDEAENSSSTGGSIPKITSGSSSTAASVGSLIKSAAAITGNSTIMAAAGIVTAAAGLTTPMSYPAGTIYTQDPTTGLYRIATPTGSKYFKAYKEVTAVAASPPSSPFGRGLGYASARLLGASARQAKLLGAQARLLGLGATGVDATTYATDTSTPTSTWIVLGVGALVAVGGIAYAMHRSKKADA